MGTINQHRRQSMDDMIREDLRKRRKERELAYAELEKNKRKRAMVDDPKAIIERPAHYTKYEIEPVEFVMKNDLPFFAGNVIKYICRAGSKTYDGMDAIESELVDLRKARRYLTMRINQIEGKDVL